MLKPKDLQKWDTIAIISPSSWIAPFVKHRIEAWKKFLENQGFKVIFAPNSLKNKEYVSWSIDERLEDIHWAFSNKKIKAIISMIGWFHCNQLVQHIDYKLVQNNPKIFIGFSDISVLHFAFYTQVKMVTFYWPAFLPQFWESLWVENYTYNYFSKAVSNTSPIWEITNSKEWTDEVLNWFTESDTKRKRIFNKNNWYIWLKDWKSNWKIIWWCLTAILHLRWTKYWPNFKDKIFFFETPESSNDITKWEPLSRVDAHLQDLALSNIFKNIKWLIVWIPKWYTDKEKLNFYKLIKFYTKNYDYPILANVNIWHTDPIITIPLWVEVSLNSNTNNFSITENWVIENS